MAIIRIDTAREIAARRALYGRPARSYRAIVADLDAGAGAVAATVRGWAAFAPKPAALDEVERAAAGLQRLIGELRQNMGGNPNEAA